MTAILAAAMLTALACVAGVALFRTRAARWGLLDVPNDRSLHVTPVPRGAGGVIGAVVIAVVLLLGATGQAGPSRYAVVFGAASLAVLIIGWMDDRSSLPASRRLAVQVGVAAGVAFAFGWYRAVEIPGFPAISLGAAGAAVTVVWVVGLVNAYNFMDGIDGLAAGQSVVTAACWIAAGMQLGAAFPVAAASVIAAGSGAFRVHNWSPARVFLGDAGSKFLGLSFAMMPLAFAADSAAPRLPLAAVLFVGVFVIDTAFTFTRRLVSGENVMQAHRTHLYQRLIACGYSHAAVAAWWLLLGAVSGAGGLIYLAKWSDLAVVLTAASVAAAMFLSVYVAEARSSTDIVSSNGRHA